MMSKTLLAFIVMTGLTPILANPKKCFQRNIGAVGNGAETTCNSVTHCRSYIIENQMVSGCGNCPTDPARPCFHCTTDNCNDPARMPIVLPDKYSCYERDGIATGSGSPKKCDTKDNKCYSYVSENKLYAGCGGCTADMQKVATCFTCSGDSCNKEVVALPAPLLITKRKCFFRNGTTTGEGSEKDCDFKYETSCFSYASEFKQFAGCGKCQEGTAAAFKCKDCNADNCNKEIITRKSIVCYKKPEVKDLSQINDPSKPSNVLCANVDTCHHYTTPDKVKIADCGKCPAGVSDCKDCTSNYCNGNSKLVATGSATIIGILMLAVMKLGF